MSAHPISTGQEQRHFERLITDVSLPFITSSGAHLDTNIEAALKAICDSLRLDYSALAQWDKAAELFVITHSWVVNGAHRAGDSLRKTFPGWRFPSFGESRFSLDAPPNFPAKPPKMWHPFVIPAQNLRFSCLYDPATRCLGLSASPARARIMNGRRTLESDCR